MTWLLILTAALLGLGLLSLVRVGGDLAYDPEGLRVRIRVGRLFFTVFPMKGGRRKEPKLAKKKPERKPRLQGEPSRQRDTLGTLKAYLPLVAETAGRLKRKVRVDLLDLDLLVAGEDPAATAMAFGWANAAIGMMIPLLENNFQIQSRNIRTGLAFQGQTEVWLRAGFSLTIGQGAALGCFVAARFLKLTTERNKTQKEAV